DDDVHTTVSTHRRPHRGARPGRPHPARCSEPAGRVAARAWSLSLKRAGARPMIVAGVMSGTSADGVDVALCRISRVAGEGSPRVRLLGMKSFSYPKPVRAEILALM